jgi:hypothetical protein
MAFRNVLSKPTIALANVPSNLAIAVINTSSKLAVALAKVPKHVLASFVAASGGVEYHDAPTDIAWIVYVDVVHAGDIRLCYQVLRRALPTHWHAFESCLVSKEGCHPYVSTLVYIRSKPNLLSWCRKPERIIARMA